MMGSSTLIPKKYKEQKGCTVIGQMITGETLVDLEAESGIESDISCMAGKIWLVQAPCQCGSQLGFALRPIRRRPYLLLVFIAISSLLVIRIGAAVQIHITKNLPDPSYLYQTGSVCAIQQQQQRTGTPASLLSSSNNTDISRHANISFLTLDSVEEAQEKEDSQVAHCGDCGQCSNPHDIKIYDDTKSTLFRDSLYCSKKSVLEGPEVVRECLDKRIGFTDECNDCWVENIMCDVRNCRFACMWYAMFHKVDDLNSSDGQQQALNPCTQCDERRCGPGFLECAGANRRRLGIMSEFERDDDSICGDVEDKWWQNETLQTQYREQE